MNSFCLMCPSGTTALVKIKSAVMRVRRVKISPQILIAHSKILSKTTVKCPINRVEMKNYTIPAGLLTVSLNNVIMGQLPVRVIVGFVNNAAVSGNFQRNYYNFQHLKINYFSLTRDGTPVSSVPLLPEFSCVAEDNCEAYYSTFSGMSNHTKMMVGAYQKLNTLEDQSASSTQWSLRRYGVFSLDVSCILYCEYQNLIEIYSDRGVTADFQRWLHFNTEL
ncbi:hypothetical protein B566_EDAN013034 [Ephemera danica]|nr:hypothetical protein B566_EDAN013034 [Ephemera danica]